MKLPLRGSRFSVQLNRTKSTLSMVAASGLLSFSLLAQKNVITEVWLENTGLQSGVFGSPTAIDAADNVYRAGFEKQSNGGAIAKLQKIDNEGQLLWTVSLTGTTVDKYEPSKVITSGSNVYLSGIVTYQANGQSDFFVGKISQSGTLQWLSIDQAAGNDVASDLVYDAGSSNLYVCGTTERAGTYDMLLASYDNSGNQNWLVYRDYAGLVDLGASVFIDGANIVVQGSSQSTSTDWDIASWFYDDGGNFSSEQHSGGLNAASDELRDGALNNGFIHLTGVSRTGANYKFKVVCLDATNNILWQDTYDKNTLREEGTALVATSNGFVATGFVTTAAGNEDILIRKYDLSGNALWTREIDVDGANDRGVDIAEDAQGNYIVVSDVEVGGQTDVYMHYIEASTGNEIWSTAVAQDGAAEEKAQSIDVTFGGEMYITYQTEGQAATEAYSYSDVDFPMDNEPFSRGSFIISNSGQLTDTNEQSITDVRYYSFGQFPGMYYSDDRMSAVVSNLSTEQTQRIDFDFVNANTTHVGQVTEYEKDAHFNYYRNLNKYEHQGTFDVLAYPGLYSNIDAFVSSNSAGFKMTFVLKNGADLNDIEIDINGSSGFNINGGNLEVNTVAGNIGWIAPYSYPKSDAEKANDGCLQYVLSGGHLKLISGCGELSYPYIITLRSGPGVSYGVTAIDNMDWSTFFGGNAHDGCYDVEVDNNGDIYIGGFTTSPKWPLNTSIVNKLTGEGIGLITKFDHGGEVKWNTVIEADKGTLGSSNPQVSVKGIGLYENISIHPGKEIHFVGQYVGDLQDGIFDGNNISSAYSQNNATIPANSTELFFGTLRGTDGARLIVSPFGGDDIEEVHAMDITADGKMYFVGSTMSDGDHSTNGSRNAPSTHTFPVFIPAQDNSFFESTHPNPGVEKRGFVSVIDLNPNSVNKYKLAYSSIITKDMGSTNTPYEAIYDISLQSSGNAYCGKGLTYARLGTFPNGSLFAEDLDQQYSEWPDKTYFSSAIAQGLNGGIFIGIDEDGTNEALKTNGAAYNMYQATTGESYIVKFGEASIIWDTYFGQSADLESPWSTGQNYIYGFYNDVRGKGKLAYNNSTKTLFTAASGASAAVEPKLKSNYFSETIIDGVYDLEDIYLAAFTTKGINHNYYNWGTMYGGAGTSQSGTQGRDYLADVETYDVGGDSYVITVSTGYSLYGTTTSDPQKYPVAKFGNSYYQDVTGNGGGYADIFITRFKVTDIDNVVSLKESDKMKYFEIYPNPTSGHLNVVLKSGDQLETLKIYTISGNNLISEQYGDKRSTVSLDISGLPKGIYLMEINGQYVEKLVKQ